MQETKSGKWYRGHTNPLVNSQFYTRCEKVEHELAVCGNGKLVLQDRAVCIAHGGHMGIVKTKALLREKIWFPRLDKAVDQVVKSCIQCQAATATPSKEPLLMSKLPKGPWKELSIDLDELPSAYHLVIIDDYSRFPVVEVIKLVSAATVIQRIDKIFFGVPNVLKSDNGSPFNSRDFQLFANDLGFKRRKITPYWPRANGEAERFMKTIKKVIKASIAAGKNWKQEMFRFLRNYSASPHSSTNVPPATALFSRPLHIKLPGVVTTPEDTEMRTKDEIAKEKMKMQADSKSYVQPSSLKDGDVVLVKRICRKSKMETPYDPQPHVITKKKGSMISAASGDHSVTRNSSSSRRLEISVNPQLKLKREILVLLKMKLSHQSRIGSVQLIFKTM
ncbi:uncharacterized protein K02A2.6-like [Anneissia japonica]|uniref:uncharacterized protein K02A2.6-like n=1 Tax=Anneissia japonica TaxID=1529436 RepID=UPI0014259B9B|nr:uncharacterized protein K02A2.6-like [Anneissia japonica]